MQTQNNFIIILRNPIDDQCKYWRQNKCPMDTLTASDYKSQEFISSQWYF